MRCKSAGDDRVPFSREWVRPEECVGLWSLGNDSLLPGESVPTSLLFKNWLFYLFGELKFLTVQFCFKLF